MRGLIELFQGRKEATPTVSAPSDNSIALPNWRGDLQLVVQEPITLLSENARSLTALRQESGFEDAQFDVLIKQVILRLANYIHYLPASNSLNHKEPGGLFQFALETAFLTFRRADGKLFRHDAIGLQRNRHDQAWRYAGFLAAICYSVGKAATQLRVACAGCKHPWNPYVEGLYSWLERHDATEYEVMWEASQDNKPWRLASLWLANNIIPTESLRYLGNVDIDIAQAFLEVIGSHDAKHIDLYSLIAESAKAAQDQYFSHHRPNNNQVGGLSIDHLMVDAIRKLIQEKWEINRPGGKIWVLEDGVYIVWKPAVLDIRLQLKAKGIVGVPESADTIAEILLEKGALLANPYGHGCAHNYKLSIHAPGIPKMPLDTVKLTDPVGIGIPVNEHEKLDVEHIGRPDNFDLDAQRDLLIEDEVESDNQETTTIVDEIVESAGKSKEIHFKDISEGEAASSDTPEKKKTTSNEQPDHFKLYHGFLKQSLETIFSEIEKGNLKTPNVEQQDEGFAISHPFVVKACDIDPDEFYRAAKSQKIIQAEHDQNKRIKKRPVNIHYLVFNDRVSKILQRAAK